MNWNGKRFVPYTDETSGIGGRARPSTYGVYDNNRSCCVIIHLEKYEDAAEQAKRKNRDKRYSKLNQLNK